MKTFWLQLEVRMTPPRRSARNLFTDTYPHPRNSERAGSAVSWTDIHFGAHLADRGWSPEQLRPDVDKEAASVASDSYE